MNYPLKSTDRHASQWLEVTDEQGRVTRVAPKQHRSPSVPRLTCSHLGPAIENASGTVLVKCGCSLADQEKRVPAHACQQFKRCLPGVQMNSQQLATWYEREEATLYKLCQTCELHPNRKESKP